VRAGALLSLAFALMLGASDARADAAPARRNLIIFVADGLRAGSVTPEDAPSMAALRQSGVSFPNSHSLFPTFTTPNASAIATGHYLGDTGDFGNKLYIGYRLFDSGNFGIATASGTAFLESDPVLADLDDHFEGNFLGEQSLLALAREHGFGTAAIGKLGPAAIQDVSQLAPKQGRFVATQTILIDDSTGSDAATPAVPLDAEVLAALERAGLPRSPPRRQQPAGTSQMAGVRAANLAQQHYFIAVATRVVLPLLRQRGLPFVLLYWSRDPDGTQHNQGDSLNELEPGIDGPSSRAAVRNADDDLRQLLEFVRADARLAASTDIFVTSDHGFSTISKRSINAKGHSTSSPAARGRYADVPPGFLPPGFLAMDLAGLLHEPLYDTDRVQLDAQGRPSYERVTQHPVEGSAVIGGNGAADDSEVQVIVAANGGSDLIYLPHGNVLQARRIASLLTGLDYLGALFVDDRYGAVPGALPLSSIGLEGSARLPHPAMVVSFKSFLLPVRPDDPMPEPLQHAVLVADTTFQQGQGMHGGFGRENTYNFMAAIGPDFRPQYTDPLPASNADIAPTLMQILGLQPSERGHLTGRVLAESLTGGAAVSGVDSGTPVPATAGAAEHCLAMSRPVPGGRRTMLQYQRFDGRLYFDQAQFRRRAIGEVAGCR